MYPAHTAARCWQREVIDAYAEEQAAEEVLRSAKAELATVSRELGVGEGAHGRGRKHADFAINRDRTIPPALLCVIQRLSHNCP